MERRQDNEAGGGFDPMVGLFVSLYFILLAFFIVLNLISNQQTARAVAVMESLESTFERPFPERASIPGLTPPARHPAVESDFLVEAGAAVLGMPGTARQKPAEGGNLLEIAIDTHGLFIVGEDRFSEQAAGLFATLSALLADAAGDRREVVFLFGDSGPQAGLARSRARALALAMTAAGSPAGSVGIGIRHGQSGRTIAARFAAAPLAATQIPLADAKGGA